MIEELVRLSREVPYIYKFLCAAFLLNLQFAIPVCPG